MLEGVCWNQVHCLTVAVEICLVFEQETCSGWTWCCWEPGCWSHSPCQYSYPGCLRHCCHGNLEHCGHQLQAALNGSGTWVGHRSETVVCSGSPDLWEASTGSCSPLVEGVCPLAVVGWTKAVDSLKVHRGTGSWVESSDAFHLKNKSKFLIIKQSETYHTKTQMFRANEVLV